MRKVLLLAIGLMLVATPVLAATVEFDMGALKPLDNGKPVLFCIDPGEELVFDDNGNPVIDPVTGLQATKLTWCNYMWCCKNLGAKVILQSVSLEKKHPPRKAACNFIWPADPLIQQGKEKCQINLCWPLLYETCGTTFTLRVVYWTERPCAVAGQRPSRTHTEIYKWTVKWDTWADLEARLAFFVTLPAGVCELPALPIAVYQEIMRQINGKGSAALGTKVLGIKELIAAGKIGEAQQKFGALEDYVDLQGCMDPCNYWNGQPKCGAEGISNNSVLPAASVILNDIYCVGRALGILIDR